MFWHDGQLVEANKIQLPIDEPGLCYGATVFTTVRVYENNLEHTLTSWQAHCDRLKATVAEFGWQQPSWKRIRQGAESMLEHFPVLRIAVFSNGKEWITGRNLPLDLAKRKSQGIIAWANEHSNYSRELAQFKTGNYLTAYLAREQALLNGAQEAILLDNQGNWLETSTGNLWGWKNDCWYTPSSPLLILKGIARQRWLCFFQTHQIQVKETIWTPGLVSSLESLYYSNCVVDLVPIKTVLTSQGKRNYSIKLPLS